MRKMAQPAHIPEAELVLDPVCGMRIDPADAAGSCDYKGKKYYFCHESCLARFKADPDSFLKPAPPAAVVPAAEYTCPMHPEIVRDGPGACPICGMALEPRTVMAEEG